LLLCCLNGFGPQAGEAQSWRKTRINLPPRRRLDPLSLSLLSLSFCFFLFFFGFEIARSVMLAMWARAAWRGALLRAGQIVR
jgi:hypothetical protein